MSSFETTASETREQMLMRLISESRYEMQLSALAPRELEATMKVWMRRLGPIPDDRLQRCFDVAMERHSTRTALIPGKVLEAWLMVRGEIEDAQRFQERESCPCACSADFWITVDEYGDPTTNFNQPVFAKACPIHRPQGWRVGEIASGNYRRPSRD